MSIFSGETISFLLVVKITVKEKFLCNTLNVYSTTALTFSLWFVTQYFSQKFLLYFIAVVNPGTEGKRFPILKTASIMF